MRVYADQAATTSLSKTALEAMLPWMTENFGNPSALYEEGRTARDAVETVSYTHLTLPTKLEV